MRWTRCRGRSRCRYRERVERSYRDPSGGCRLWSGWGFERRDVLWMKRDPRGAFPEVQGEQHAAVTRDGRAYRRKDRLDLERVQATGEQEALGATSRGLAAVEFELLHVHHGPLLVALDAQQAGGHVVGVRLGLPFDAVEQRSRAGVRSELREQLAQPRRAEQLAPDARLHDAVGVEADERSTRDRDGALARARLRARPDRRGRAGGGRGGGAGRGRGTGRNPVPPKY